MSSSLLSLDEFKDLLIASLDLHLQTDTLSLSFDPEALMASSALLSPPSPTLRVPKCFTGVSPSSPNRLFRGLRKCASAFALRTPTPPSPPPLSVPTVNVIPSSPSPLRLAVTPDASPAPRSTSLVNRVKRKPPPLHLIESAFDAATTSSFLPPSRRSRSPSLSRDEASSLTDSDPFGKAAVQVVPRATRKKSPKLRERRPSPLPLINTGAENDSSSESDSNADPLPTAATLFEQHLWVSPANGHPYSAALKSSPLMSHMISAPPASSFVSPRSSSHGLPPLSPPLTPPLSLPPPSPALSPPPCPPLCSSPSSSISSDEASFSQTPPDSPDASSTSITHSLSTDSGSAESTIEGVDPIEWTLRLGVSLPLPAPLRDALRAKNKRERKLEIGAPEDWTLGLGAGTGMPFPLVDFDGPYADTDGTDTEFERVTAVRQARRRSRRVTFLNVRDSGYAETSRVVVVNAGMSVSADCPPSILRKDSEFPEGRYGVDALVTPRPVPKTGRRREASSPAPSACAFYRSSCDETEDTTDSSGVFYSAHSSLTKIGSG